MAGIAAIARRFAPVFAVALLMAVSSCSTTEVMPAPATASSVSAEPGNGSPEQAVAGMFQAELAGDWSDSCHYRQEPFTQPGACAPGLSATPSVTGSYHIVNQMISGDLALVFATGSICYSGGGGCRGNSDPTAGVPRSPADFDSVFGQVANEGNTFSPIPCRRVNGQWYVSGMSW